MMGRPAFLLRALLSVLFALSTVTACGSPDTTQEATPTILPPRTLVAPTPATAAVADAPAQRPMAEPTNAPMPFTLQLPPGWISHELDPTSGVELSIDAPAWMSERLAALTSEGATSMLLLAWPTNEIEGNTPIGMLSLATPAADLRLPAIVSATVVSMERTPNVVVTGAALHPNLRPNGDPTARIDYRLGAERGVQYIIYDVATRLLVVLTFFGATEKMDKFAPLFDDIVGSVAVAHE